MTKNCFFQKTDKRKKTKQSEVDLSSCVAKADLVVSCFSRGGKTAEFECQKGLMLWMLLFSGWFNPFCVAACSVA